MYQEEIYRVDREVVEFLFHFGVVSLIVSGIVAFAFADSRKTKVFPPWGFVVNGLIFGFVFLALFAKDADFSILWPFFTFIYTLSGTFLWSMFEPTVKYLWHAYTRPFVWIFNAFASVLRWAWAIVKRRRAAAIDRKVYQPRREQEMIQSETRRKQLELENRRRQNARSACELKYLSNQTSLKGRFSRKDLDKFMDSFMTDSHPVEDVESRSMELQRLIEHHAATDPTQKKPADIQQLSEWYLAEKGRIEQLPLDEMTKEEHLFLLNQRYAQLTQELLENIKP